MEPQCKLLLDQFFLMHEDHTRRWLKQELNSIGDLLYDRFKNSCFQIAASSSNAETSYDEPKSEVELMIPSLKVDSIAQKSTEKQSFEVLRLKCTQIDCDFFAKNKSELVHHLFSEHQSLDKACLQKGCGSSFAAM